jgi:hypothetical protein
MLPMARAHKNSFLLGCRSSKVHANEGSSLMVPTPQAAIACCLTD